MVSRHLDWFKQAQRDLEQAQECQTSGRHEWACFIARYLNSHPAGAPFEHYGALQSEAAVSYAREILDFVRVQMA